LAIVVAEYSPYVFIAVLIYLWLSPKIDGKHSALFAGYSAVVGILINRFISFFCLHPRPFMENVGTTLINHVPESSFPSDHTTFMLSIATMLLFIKSTRIIGCILFLFGVLCGTSRVFCGVHFPLDIFGSLLVSMVSTSVIWVLRKKLIVINEFTVNVYSRVFSRKKSNTTIKHTVNN
jgi:undecaprenyl-diphosphatase